MCGRYTVRTPLGLIVDAFSPLIPRFTDLQPRYNIAPTQDVPVIRLNREGGRVLTNVRWGLIPSWAKDPSIGNRNINARSETAAAKPTFRQAMQRRRCLLPADGFYEWQAQTGGEQPYFIHMKDNHVFAFAGLWERWRAAEDVEPVDTCTLLTTRPNELMEPIHNRMPVIVKPSDYSRWLSADTPAAELTDVLEPYPAQEMEAFPVSTRVNRPANDEAACVTPLEVKPK